MAQKCGVCGSGSTGAMFYNYVCHDCGAITAYADGAIHQGSTIDVGIDPNVTVVDTRPLDQRGDSTQAAVEAQPAVVEPEPQPVAQEVSGG